MDNKHKPNYYYNVGDIVNGLLLLSQSKMQVTNNSKKKGFVYCKSYICQCLKDGYEFEMLESCLKRGHGCSVCSGNKVVMGINDLATTDAWCIPLLVDESDAHLYSRGSSKEISVRCPYCGLIKEMQIFELTKRGYVTCQRCSDGFSYPMKFIVELLGQLSKQFTKHETEYSPSWAGDFRYDNYVKLKNGKEIIIEMDGRFHYIKDDKFSYKNDAEKDFLALNNGIEVIRIDCNYLDIKDRYEYVKNNIIKSLSCYFNMSNVDWDKCNVMGMSSKMMDVINYYNNNITISIKDIAEHFGVSMLTAYNYVHIGDNLGMCKYIKGNPVRSKKIKEIKLYDLNNNLVGVFESAKQLVNAFPEENFNLNTIQKYAKIGKKYKNYFFIFTENETA